MKNTNISTSKDKQAVLAAMGTTLCYGITPVFLRYFTDYLDFWTVNGMRYSVGALFWFPFVVVLLRRKTDPHHKNIWRDALVPASANLLGQVAWGLSPYFLEATVIGFVYKLHILTTILFGFLLIKEERPLVREKWFFIGVFVSIAGVVGMFLEDLSGTSKPSLVGLVICLASTTFFGLYAVLVRRCVKGYPARLSFGVISLYTALGLVSLMFLFGDYGQVCELSGKLWGLVILSAMLGIAIAHVLYYRAIHGLGAIISTGLLMATPFVGFAGAYVTLGERITWLQFGGGLAVVAGGAMLVVAKSRAALDVQ